MSRELMWHADWAAHTAKQMGIDDYDIMPERYAHRLKLRTPRRGWTSISRSRKNYARLSQLAGKDVLPD
jgi:hypothetical protein